MATVVKNLGAVTAYRYAVEGGYTGTEEEFTAMLGQIATDMAEIENLSATASTLPEGSSATASYNNGVISFGIPKGDKGDKGNKGDTGATGNGIASVAKTGTSGLVDTYTITFTNGSTTTFQVTNGQDGEVTTQQMNQAIATVVADEFSPTKADGYSIGDYCIYGGTLYRFINAHTGAWNARDVEATYVGGEIADLREDFEIETGKVNLDSVAINGKTYRDIFVTNNKLPYGDFESGLDWINANTGGAVITEDECVTKLHSLKCFGTSSVQIRKDITYNAGQIYIACKAHVLRRSAGNVGFTASASSLAYAITSPTNGFVTASKIASVSSASSPQSVFFGTYSSANADAYIDDAVFLHLTDCFGENIPTKAQMDAIYEKWISIKNANYESSRISIVEEKVDNIANAKPVFVGAVLGATSGANRYAAMRELYTVAQKVLDDPTYQPSDLDLTYASEGAVCVLPSHNSAMYQKFNFDILYAKNGTVQAVPASTTKVMTLVTGLDFISDVYERVTISSDDIEDGSSSILQSGDIVTINDLIYAMMLPSSNTSAIAFSRVAGKKILESQNGEGSYTDAECKTAFLAQMAVKASNLGMTDSTFVSPSGRSENNLTTVKDMLRFTIDACSYPEILRIWNKKSYDIAVKGTNARTVHIETSVADTTLESMYYIFGGKTGTLSLQNTAIALVMVAQKL